MMESCLQDGCCSIKQEPWRLPSRQAEFDETDSLRLDAHSDDQAVTGNQGYFER